ncbi:MAG TPA: redoxin domain-containing protein [Candidatus Angelobacter sp.]
MSSRITVPAHRRFLASPLFFLMALFLSASPVLVAAAQNQEPRFNDEFEAGKKAALQNDNVEAARRFTRANELRQNKCSDCLVWLARIAMVDGKFDDALNFADQALAVAANGPQRCNADLYRGVILGRQGNLAQSETAFKAAASLDPQCTECRFNLGFVLLKESKDAEGVAVLKTVAPQFAGTPRGRELQRFIADPSRIRKNYAPEFSAKLSTGEEVNLDTLKGKVVLLDFWGVWCSFCRVSLPSLKELAAKIDPARVAIISIDEYDPQPQWEQFTQANGMNWGQVYDRDRALHNAFRVDGFPRYYILSKDGIILEEFKGWNQNGETTISDAIARALQH